MVKQMRNSRYREDQWRHRYDRHVADLNRFVDGLVPSTGEGPPPYIAAHYRPQSATVLTVFRDPGPKAGKSGFLSYENDDETAARLERFLRQAGLDPDECLPWNAYPWFVHKVGESRDLTRQQIEKGMPILFHIVQSLPTLKAIVGFGKSSGAAVERLDELHGPYIRGRGILVDKTFHTSPNALRTTDAEERRAREVNIRATLLRVAGHVGVPTNAASVQRSEANCLVDVDVCFEPAASGPAAVRWQSAVRQALGGFKLPSHDHASLTVEFRLDPTQERSAARALDPLAATTIDALGTVVGRRIVRNAMETDRERLNDIRVTQRLCGPDESPGARITISAVPQITKQQPKSQGYGGPSGRLGP